MSRTTRRGSPTISLIRRLTFLLATTVVVTLIATGVAAAPASAAPPSAALYATAKRALAAGNGPAATAALGTLLATDPTNAKALALRAVSADFGYDFVTKTDSLNRLTTVDSALRGRVDRMLNTVADVALRPPNPFPAVVGPGTAIVILGYGLLPNGAMRPELVGRLEAGLVQALMAPASPIIVTGGNPHNGITEAAAMKAWLAGHLVPTGRIHAESKAPSTVGNAIDSTALMRTIGASNAVLVSDPDHVRRATVDFITAGTAVVGAMSTLNGYFQQVLPVLPKSEQRSMYVDGASVLGL
ncbi:YdcF family protein [Williamsia sterculiae]|uniref:DUF218 domain-containing protein n=1 Tax=Williamsia sterculiae TaxID=1344003 RepID=A0A1N7EIJ2_9NOCA|nr:YdcF family protein [Williamsia sterculiae]SIR87809.1 DUF218 domain-containing protein [Williamsia sterculiae]